MSDLPAPLTPPECDLRGVPMPFSGADFFSREAIDGDEVAVARLRLMWFAWRRTPAASIPAQHDGLFRVSGLSARRWRHLKALVLQGWIECADGQLYHPDLAEAANEAWRHISAIRAKGARINIKSHEWRAIRTLIFERDDFTCGYCGERGGRLECDHVVPVAQGGGNDPGNLITACFRCNRSKGARRADEWRRA